MNKVNKTIIFDFDGVIVDTFDFCYRIVKDNYQPDLTPEKYRERFTGNIYEHKETKGVVEKGKQNNVEFFSLYIPEVMKKNLIPGMEEVIKRLSEQHELFIISSTSGEAIQKFLEKENVLQYFKEIYGSDVHKSKVVKIQMLLTKYNLNPEDCLFITDTLGDIVEAKKCKVDSAAVSWGYHDKETLNQGHPVALVDSPIELLEFIKSQNV